MAFFYKKNPDIKKANYYMEKSFEIYLRKKIKQQLSCENADNYETKYLYQGGRNNLGQLISINMRTSKKYITNIIPIDYNTLFKREIYFNEIIRNKSKVLQNITPKLVSNKKVSNKLLLLTFENKEQETNKKLKFEKMIELSDTLAKSFSYNEILKLLKQTESADIYTSLALSMHIKRVHQLIIDNMKINASRLNDESVLLEIIKELEYYIIELKTYKKIIPERDYVLCHGDLNTGNIIVTENNNYIIDWEHYGLGLRGIDLSFYIADSGYRFDQIQKEFIPCLYNKTNDYTIEKIFLFINYWTNGYIN